MIAALSLPLSLALYQSHSLSLCVLPHRQHHCYCCPVRSTSYILSIIRSNTKSVNPPRQMSWYSDQLIMFYLNSVQVRAFDLVFALFKQLVPDSKKVIHLFIYRGLAQSDAATTTTISILIRSTDCGNKPHIMLA